MSNIYKDVKKWIKRITTPKDGYQICPYARSAKYAIYTSLDRATILELAIYWRDKYDLIICQPSNTSMTVEDALSIEETCNYLAKDTITLLDHPDDPGYIDGVYTGNGKHILFLIQSKKDLQKARLHLKTTSYYDRWTDEYYEEVVKEKRQ